ncbi:hypothetical protein BC834DRAFT_860138 [Gloeopeniophorella convolvens]|nr:hypothetical protein BC834DRAFT_860138 [Gloeopeniophorella convolvens]
MIAVRVRVPRTARGPHIVASATPHLISRPRVFFYVRACGAARISIPPTLQPLALHLHLCVRMLILNSRPPHPFPDKCAALPGSSRQRFPRLPAIDAHLSSRWHAVCRVRLWGDERHLLETGKDAGAWPWLQSRPRRHPSVTGPRSTASLRLFCSCQAITAHLGFPTRCLCPLLTPVPSAPVFFTSPL